MNPQSILFGITAVLIAPVIAQSTTTALQNQPSQEPHVGEISNVGCFDSSKGLELLDEDLDFNTDGKCGLLCSNLTYNVAATSGGQECWCGSEYPPEDSLVGPAECNIPCTGFADTACGGLDRWSILNTGIKLAVHYYEETTSSSTSTTDAPTSSTSATATAPATSEPPKEGSGKTIGIAVGVVVGVLILAGVGGGVFLWMRKKRNQEIEEDHRRNAAVNAFINGSGPPSSSHGSISMTDSRLDPIMAHRRLSEGSIADNQDYSRKILRVTNA